MPSTVQIIIADDHNLFIEGLLLLLKDETDLEVTAIANNASELMELLKKNAPDIVLLDINMPGMSGVDALKQVKERYRGIKVIMLSTYNEEHLISKSKLNGAHGYLLKNVNKDELIETIRLINTGVYYFPQKKSSDHHVFSENDPFLARFSLTKREKELLQFIKKSYTNHQIADILHLSIYTVETHRKNIMQKLKLKNPVELMKFILQNNL